jgi:acyl-CoA dehydrogenase
MTEPGVASSDATNMQATASTDGDDVVLNGRKWYISGATDPRCEVLIVMALDSAAVAAGAARHQQHTMVIVPMRTAGVKVLRPMRVYVTTFACVCVRERVPVWR